MKSAAEAAGYYTFLDEMVTLNSRITNLERSNKEMHDFDPKDKELEGYIKENEGIIVKYRKRIQQIMDILVAQYGVTPEALDVGLRQLMPDPKPGAHGSEEMKE